MSDDCISRNDAIETCKAEFLNTNVQRQTETQTLADQSFARGWNACNRQWMSELSQLPSAQSEDVILHITGRRKFVLKFDFDEDEPEQQWIPCSERLPDDENGKYWVCTDTEYQCECRWTNINHIWTDLTTEWHWHIADVPQYSKVIAWMPLPAPYKEEQE